MAWLGPFEFDVRFWSQRYPISTLFEYRSLVHGTGPAATLDRSERVERLLAWKQISRVGLDPDDVLGVVDGLAESELVSTADEAGRRERLALVRSVRSELGIDSGVVVPQFVVHLADSLGTGYSPRFPVFDNLVWTAVVCLYDAATEIPARLALNDRRSRSLAYDRFPCGGDATRYEVLTAVFDARRTSGVDIPRLERALFVAGGLIVGQDLSTVSEARELVGAVQDGRCGGYYGSERPEQ